MNRNTICSLLLLSIVVMMGACHDDAWESVPTPIMDFLTKYFPLNEVQSYTDDNKGTLTVQIKNGAKIVFDDNYGWMHIESNGIPLPSQVLYDELPAPLYNYIQEMEQTQSVFGLKREASTITVYFHDTAVNYNIATERITYPSAP